ncbi:MAG: VWA domain-containing protein [Gammaproteobacteria bacterium]
MAMSYAELGGFGKPVTSFGLGRFIGLRARVLSRPYPRISWLIFLASLFAYSAETNAVGNDESAVLHHDVVLVLDNSGSMKKVDPHGSLREVVQRFVEAMHEGTRVGVVIFAERDRLLFPLTSFVDVPPAVLGARLQNLDYQGAFTHLPLGIERALYELRHGGRADAVRSIFLVTDGIVDLGDRSRVEKVTGWLTTELAAQAAGDGIGIFSIVLSEQADYRLLQSLAQATKGEYFRVGDVNDVLGVLGSLAAGVAERSRHGPRAGSAKSMAAPMGTELTLEQEGSVAESSRTPALRVSPASLSGEPMLILPLSILNARLWPLGWNGIQQLSLTRLAAAVSLTLVAIGVLLTWALLSSGGGRARRGKAVPALASTSCAGVPRAFLYDLNGATDGALHEVSNRITMIGRPISTTATDATYSHLLLDDPTISRWHAVIEYRRQGFWLIDQRSRNGTYVGGERVLDPVCLKHNDRITFSRVEFEFHIAAMDEAAETVQLRS